MSWAQLFGDNYDDASSEAAESEIDGKRWVTIQWTENPETQKLETKLVDEEEVRKAIDEEFSDQEFEPEEETDTPCSNNEVSDIRKVENPKDGNKNSSEDVKNICVRLLQLTWNHLCGISDNARSLLANLTLQEMIVTINVGGRNVPTQQRLSEEDELAGTRIQQSESPSDLNAGKCNTWTGEIDDCSSQSKGLPTVGRKPKKAQSDVTGAHCYLRFSILFVCTFLIAINYLPACSSSASAFLQFSAETIQIAAVDTEPVWVAKDMNLYNPQCPPWGAGYTESESDMRYSSSPCLAAEDSLEFHPDGKCFPTKCYWVDNDLSLVIYSQTFLTSPPISAVNSSVVYECQNDTLSQSQTKEVRPTLKSTQCSLLSPKSLANISNHLPHPAPILSESLNHLTNKNTSAASDLKFGTDANDREPYGAQCPANVEASEMSDNETRLNISTQLALSFPHSNIEPQPERKFQISMPLILTGDTKRSDMRSIQNDENLNNTFSTKCDILDQPKPAQNQSLVPNNQMQGKQWPQYTGTLQYIAVSKGVEMQPFSMQRVAIHHLWSETTSIAAYQIMAGVGDRAVMEVAFGKSLSIDGDCAKERTCAMAENQCVADGSTISKQLGFCGVFRNSAEIKSSPVRKPCAKRKNEESQKSSRKNTAREEGCNSFVACGAKGHACHSGLSPSSSGSSGNGGDDWEKDKAEKFPWSKIAVIVLVVVWRCYLIKRLVANQTRFQQQEGVGLLHQLNQIERFEGDFDSGIAIYVQNEFSNTPLSRFFRAGNLFEICNTAIEPDEDWTWAFVVSSYRSPWHDQMALSRRLTPSLIYSQSRFNRHFPEDIAFYTPGSTMPAQQNSRNHANRTFASSESLLVLGVQNSIALQPSQMPGSLAIDEAQFNGEQRTLPTEHCPNENSSHSFLQASRPQLTATNLRAVDPEFDRAFQSLNALDDDEDRNEQEQHFHVPNFNHQVRNPPIRQLRKLKNQDRVQNNLNLCGVPFQVDHFPHGNVQLSNFATSPFPYYPPQTARKTNELPQHARTNFPDHPSCHLDPAIVPERNEPFNDSFTPAQPSAERSSTTAVEDTNPHDNGNETISEEVLPQSASSVQGEDVLVNFTTSLAAASQALGRYDVGLHLEEKHPVMVDDSPEVPQHVKDDESTPRKKLPVVAATASENDRYVDSGGPAIPWELARVSVGQQEEFGCADEEMLLRTKRLGEQNPTDYNE